MMPEEVRRPMGFCASSTAFAATPRTLLIPVIGTVLIFEAAFAIFICTSAIFGQHHHPAFTHRDSAGYFLNHLSILRCSPPNR